jgi:hypothetical protein
MNNIAIGDYYSRLKNNECGTPGRTMDYLKIKK